GARPRALALRQAPTESTFSCSGKSGFFLPAHGNFGFLPARGRLARRAGCQHASRAPLRAIPVSGLERKNDTQWVPALGHSFCIYPISVICVQYGKSAE